MADARIMLVKPGDILVFGNVGPLADDDVLRPVAEKLKAITGVALVVFFEEDIDVEAVPSR